MSVFFFIDPVCIYNNYITPGGSSGKCLTYEGIKHITHIKTHLIITPPGAQTDIKLQVSAK